MTRLICFEVGLVSADRALVDFFAEVVRPAFASGHAYLARSGSVRDLHRPTPRFSLALR